MRSSRLPIFAFVALTCALAALVSCAGTPPVRSPGSAAVWLGGQPRMVVRIDATQVSAWKTVTQPREALRTVGERTKTVWIGLDLDNLDDLKNAAHTVRIVLEGDFPKGAAGLMLDWNSSWKKGTVPGVWSNAKMGLSVSLPEDNLVTVRRGQPAGIESNSGALRGIDPRAIEASGVWISFWNPGQALFGSVGAKLIPITRLDVSLTPHEGKLEGPVILHFDDDRSAKAAEVILKLLNGQIRSRFGQELSWRADQLTVVGTTLSIKQEDLTSLAEKLVGDSSDGGPQ